MCVMLSEIGVAIEMGADAEDIALTIQAHPTLNESIGLAVEIFEGSITFRPNPEVKKKEYIANKAKVPITTFLGMAGLAFFYYMIYESFFDNVFA
jgi:hypothetical protein